MRFLTEILFCVRHSFGGMPDQPIRYSAHLLWRLALRGIEPALPARLIREANERYLDAVTGYGIAVAVVAGLHAKQAGVI